MVFVPPKNSFYSLFFLSHSLILPLYLHIRTDHIDIACCLLHVLYGCAWRTRTILCVCMLRNSIFEFSMLHTYNIWHNICFGKYAQALYNIFLLHTQHTLMSFAFVVCVYETAPIVSGIAQKLPPHLIFVYIASIYRPPTHPHHM